MSSGPYRFPCTKCGWHGRGQGGKPSIPHRGTPEGNTLGFRRGAEGMVRFGGAALLTGVQVQVLLTSAALPALLHVTWLPGLVSPCV